MAAKTKSPNGTAALDFATLMPSQRRYDRFTMDQDEDDTSEPFWVKVQRLTAAEVEEIPAGNELMKDIIVDFRQYFVAWNLTATDAAGDEKPVPPPAELDEDNFRIVAERLLLSDQVRFLYQTIRAGDMLKVFAEKKALLKSVTTPESPPEGS